MNNYIELEPINRICPKCGSGNDMRLMKGGSIGDLNVKCLNCNAYFTYEELTKQNTKCSADRIIEALEGYKLQAETHPAVTVSSWIVLNTIDILKEKEETIPEEKTIQSLDDYSEYTVPVCSKCGEKLMNLYSYRWNHCPMCGRKIKWE